LITVFFAGTKKIQSNSKKNQQKTNSIVKKQNKKLTKTQPNNEKTKQKGILSSISPSLLLRAIRE
jgi:hypothetical protein